MPAAALCDKCGKKKRSDYHLCHPTAVEKHRRRKKVWASTSPE